MGRAGDDRLVDPQPHPDRGPGGDPFDPGLETGYLRRAPRDHELEPELGAHPFDPGPGRYDDRRAQKAARRERRERSRRDERAARIDPQIQIPPPAPTGPVAAAAAQASPAPAPIAIEPVVEPEPPEPPERTASVTELHPRVSMGARLERERAERERAERERRARIEHGALHRGPAGPDPVQRPRPVARRRPSVSGPVRPRRGLLWPTAKAGIAITIALGLSAALGSMLGLPVPGPSGGTGQLRLASSADLFGIDPGTPTGLASGYVFPLIGPHDFGDGEARFGASRYGHVHEGQDIFGKTGIPEVAVHDGVVVDWGTENGRWSGGRGNYIAIYSPEDDHSFVYMHMLKPSPVHMGVQVHAGQVIGQLGCTGSCEGPHLHFEVRIGRATLRSDTKPVDPLPYLRQWPEATPG
jgi:murein DD-endopeptidase MepM/ murein hydrolase activator NlpD